MNAEAADELQDIVDRIRSGEIVGVAWVSLKPNGSLQCGWDCPTNMGEHIYYGVSTLAYKIMKDTNG